MIVWDECVGRCELVMRERQLMFDFDLVLCFFLFLLVVVVVVLLRFLLRSVSKKKKMDLNNVEMCHEK